MESLHIESLHIESLPTLSDTSICDSCRDSCSTYWIRHRSYIICSMITIILTAVVLTIVLIQPKTSNYPCLTYDQNSLASSVSISCLQYTWDSFCKTSNPYTFPQGYTGWWRQSPQGTAMISCHSSLLPCGVGSYGNIVIYMNLCQIGFNQ